MLTFRLRRVLLVVPILCGVSVVVFWMVHLVPGDPIRIMLGHSPSGADIQLLRHELGLDAPLPVQYVSYVGHALHGDLGTSIRSNRPVVDEIADRFPETLQLTVAAMAVAIVLGVGVGTLAAARRSRLLEGALMLGATLGVSLPGGWVDQVTMRCMDILLAFPDILLAIVIIAILGPGLVNVMVAVGIGAIPVYTWTVRASVLGVREQEFVEAARALGVPAWRIMWWHILRNVTAPIIVLATLGVGLAILTAAGLSFIGLGAQPPTPE